MIHKGYASHYYAKGIIFSHLSLVFLTNYLLFPIEASFHSSYCHIARTDIYHLSVKLSYLFLRWNSIKFLWTILIFFWTIHVKDFKIMKSISKSVSPISLFLSCQSPCKMLQYWNHTGGTAKVPSSAWQKKERNETLWQIQL